MRSIVQSPPTGESSTLASGAFGAPPVRGKGEAHSSASPIAVPVDSHGLISGRQARDERRPMPRLPDDPNLEHLKGQAKTLLTGARAADERALQWVREYHPDPPARAQARRRAARGRPRLRLPQLAEAARPSRRGRDVQALAAPGAAARRSGGRVPAARVPDLLAGRPRALGGGGSAAHAGDRARLAARGGGRGGRRGGAARGWPT